MWYLFPYEPDQVPCMAIAPSQQAQSHCGYLTVAPGLVEAAEEVAAVLGVQLLQLGTQLKQLTRG